MTRLTLLSRPGCHLCEEMRREADEILAGTPVEWKVVDVDSDPDLSRRWGDSIPVLFVGGRLFAKVRLPRLAAARKLRRAVERGAPGSRD